MGVVIDGVARAYPHNVLNHHEIVSDRVGDRWVTATFCPLTGSGLVFDPHVGAEKLDIGVSGLIFANNLVLSAEQIPVGAGQWDYTGWLEAGLSLYPLPAYAVLWLGRRWRTLNEKTTRDPGDELALLAEFGVTSIVGGLGGKVTLDGIFAETGSIQGIAVSSDEAEILYLAPGLMYQITSSTALEAAICIPLWGKNFPAGSPLMIALFHTGSALELTRVGVGPPWP